MSVSYLPTPPRYQLKLTDTRVLYPYSYVGKNPTKNPSDDRLSKRKADRRISRGPHTDRCLPRVPVPVRLQHQNRLTSNGGIRDPRPRIRAHRRSSPGARNVRTILRQGMITELTLYLALFLSVFFLSTQSRLTKRLQSTRLITNLVLCPLHPRPLTLSDVRPAGVPRGTGGNGALQTGFERILRTESF